MFPLSLTYRQEPHAPFWGEVNSAANFCEEDHVITAYIAEFINTFSSFIYVIYAYRGIKNNRSRRDAILRNLPYLGIAGVGIGSAIFHASLKNYTQWCDELSMHIATGTVLHRVFTFDKSLSTTVISGVIFSIFMVLFIAWHCITDEFIGHCILFGIMIILVGIKTRSLIKGRVPDRAIRRELSTLTTWASIIFVTGFIAWNIDNLTCTHLTAAKRDMGMPWSFLLELHGWWHVFTGMGAYIFIALVEYLTSEDAGKPLGHNFAWPVGIIINGSAGTKIPSLSANGEGKYNGVLENRNRVRSNGTDGNGKKDL